MTAAMLAACALAAFPAVAMSSAPDDAVLSPRLGALARPSLRSAPPAKQARALSLAPSGPGSLLRRGDRVLVDVSFDSGAVASVDELRATGARIVNVSRRYQTVTVAATPASLPGLGEIAGVRGVTEDLAPLVSATTTPALTSTTTPCFEGFGAATSEGDLQLNAMKARTAFGVDGSGVTVGILSDSFDLDPTAAMTAAEDVASGDLPGPGNPCGHSTPVHVLGEPSLAADPEPTDEGRAMAQIVHDLAPGSLLAFATAFGGEPAFAENIAKLAAPVGSGGAGAKVIVDDIAYFEEPFFQEGRVGVAVSEATESKGVTYFSAAGNNNLIDSGGRNIGSWEAPAFRDGGTCPAGTPAYAAHCMDFNPGAGVDKTFGISVAPEETLILDLQWGQPWFGVTTDLDPYLLVGSTRVGESEDPNTNPAIQKPVEILSWTNPSSSEEKTVNLAIDRCDGVCGIARALAHPELQGTSGGDTGTPPLKFALIENGGGVTETEYPESSGGPGGDVVGPTVFGHNGGTDVMSTGAIRFDNNTKPERFSSRGPVTHYFGPVIGTTPAPMATEVLHKPDVVATDGSADTFFGVCVSNTWRFFGTSAAAPHAAAVAALELSAEPLASVAEIKDAQTETAKEILPTDAAGEGLVDAYGALGQLASPVTTGMAHSPGFPAPICPPVKPSAPVATAGPVPAATTVPPETSFARHPHRVVRVPGKFAFVSFRFHSDQSGATFLCAVDGQRLHLCSRRLSRRFGLGPHRVRAAARNSAGEVDPTPAVFRFRVKRIG
jgi:hypothetical protein